MIRWESDDVAVVVHPTFGEFTLRVVESGLASLGKDPEARRKHYDGNPEGWEARELVYRALGGRLSDVARDLERIGRSWEARLARIKRLAEGAG